MRDFQKFPGDVLTKIKYTLQLFSKQLVN